jgi:hypothetical protein
MYWFLNWRLWAALVVAFFLAGTHWKAYTEGGKSVQAAWDADKAREAAEKIAAIEQARKKEQDLNDKVRRVSNDYQREKAAHEIANGGAGKDSIGTAGANGTGGLEQELLGNCARTLVRLGQEADRLEAKVVGLQAYIAAIGGDK